MSLTLHVRDDGTVHLNDAPVEVPSGVSPFRAGIDAAKRAAATMNEEVVPLTARTDAETFELLIVRGAVVDAESARAADPDSIAVKLPTPAPAPTLPENATDDQRLDERVDEAVAPHCGRSCNRRRLRGVGTDATVVSRTCSRRFDDGTGPLAPRWAGRAGWMVRASLMGRDRHRGPSPQSRHV